MNKFSAYRITNASLLKNYIFGAFTRYKAGTLQDALIIRFRDAMLLARRRPVLHQLLCIHLALVHFSMGKRPTGTFDADRALDDLEPWTSLHQPPHQPEVAPRHGLSRPQTMRPFMACSAALCSSTSCFSWSLIGIGCSVLVY